VKARLVAFREPDRQYEMEDTHTDDGIVTSRQRTPLTSKLLGAWIKSVGDPTNWRTVDGLTKAVEECKFLALRLQIINATCEGGELVARAWCSENEQKAVIMHASGPCLLCAVKMVSENGLGVNCLIWA
jgi:hypothetical protein